MLGSGWLRCGGEVLLRQGSRLARGRRYPKSGCLRSLVRLYSTSMKRKTSARACALVSQTVVPISASSRPKKLSAAALSQAGTGSPPPLPQTQFRGEGPGWGGGVFTSTVGMHEASGFHIAAAGGHLQCVDDEFGSVVVGHRVSDHLTGRKIEDGRQVPPAGKGGR